MADENEVVEFFLPSSRRAAEEAKAGVQPTPAPAEGFLPSSRAPQPPAISEDIARTAAATTPKALLGTALGGLGSVETFATKELPQLARLGAAKVGEKLDILSPAEAETMATKPLYSSETEAQKAGREAPLTGLPTYKGITETIQERAKAGLAPEFMGYEPKTAPGKITESAITGAVQAMPGGPAMGARMLLGAGAGAGAEAFGQAAKGADQEETSRIVGSIAGALGAGAGASVIGKLTNAISSVVRDTTAQKNIAKSLAADLERGQSGMTPDQVRAAMERGEPVSVYDMAGPQTRKMLSEYTDVSPENRQLAAEHNKFLEDRRVDAGSRIAEHLSGVTGRTIDAATLQSATEDAGKITRNNVYNLVRSDPTSAAISIKDIGGDLANRPMFQKAMKDAETTAKNNPDWNIQVPSFTPARPAGAPSKEMVGLEMVEKPGVAGVPARDIPGNISYWDQVKRELDAEIKKAQRSGDTTTLASAQAIKKQLTDRLDNMVTGYKKARDVASETFGAASAPEAGYDFFGKTNQFKLKDIKDAFLQYTPEQKDLFAHGVASRIQDEALAGRLTSLNNKFTKDVNFQNRMKMALGEDRFEAIKGKVLSENLLSNAEHLKFIAEKVTPTKAGIATAGAVAGLEAAAAGVSVEGVLRAIAAGTTVAGAKVVFNALERKIAERALPLALSQDPKDLAILAKMVEQEPLTNKVLDRLNTAMTVAIPQYEQAKQSSERMGRATGGRTSGGMTAQGLISAVEAARKNIQKTTEKILSAPDESVVKALEIANEHI
jgi:hypothetical protein